MAIRVIPNWEKPVFYFMKRKRHLMLHEYSRTELLIGEAGVEKLRNSTVAVFGVGGVGSYVVGGPGKSRCWRTYTCAPRSGKPYESEQAADHSAFYHW